MGDTGSNEIQILIYWSHWVRLAKNHWDLGVIPRNQEVQTLISTDHHKFTCISEVLGISVITRDQVNQTFHLLIILGPPDKGSQKLGGGVTPRSCGSKPSHLLILSGPPGWGPWELWTDPEGRSDPDQPAHQHQQDHRDRTQLQGRGGRDGETTKHH